MVIILVRAYFTFLTPPLREMNYRTAMATFCRQYGNANIHAKQREDNEKVRDVYDYSKKPPRKVGFIEVLDNG